MHYIPYTINNRQKVLATVKTQIRLLQKAFTVRYSEIRAFTVPYSEIRAFTASYSGAHF